jgi:hypothetical protein
VPGRRRSARDGTIRDAEAGLVDRVEDPQFLPLGPGLGPERLGQSQLVQGAPARLGVQIEGAALGAGAGMGVPLVDGGRDPLPMQHSGQRETADAAADDSDPRLLLLAGPSASSPAGLPVGRLHAVHPSLDRSVQRTETTVQRTE